MLLCHTNAYFNTTISSADVTKLKCKQSTKLSTNGCTQIILQPLSLRTVQINPIATVAVGTPSDETRWEERDTPARAGQARLHGTANKEKK